MGKFSVDIYGGEAQQSVKVTGLSDDSRFARPTGVERLKKFPSLLWDMQGLLNKRLHDAVASSSMTTKMHTRATFRTGLLNR